MDIIKTYKDINEGLSTNFRMTKMEDLYEKFKDDPDKPHRHNYYTVIFVQQAKGTHIIDFNEYLLEPNQVFFVGPGQVHQILEKEQSIGYSMVFSSEFLAKNNIPLCFIEDLNLFQNYGQSPPIYLEKKDTEQLLIYSENINKYNNSNHKFKDDAIGALMKLFLIYCHQLCTSVSDNLQQIEVGNTILKGFRELVEQKYKQNHLISEYASELNITPDHLNRTIKSLIGKTAKEYIQSRITIAAKRMLYFSDLSSKEIGYELGFSEPANFSSFFKKETGLSPSQFRKND